MDLHLEEHDSDNDKVKSNLIPRFVSLVLKKENKTPYQVTQDIYS